MIELSTEKHNRTDITLIDISCDELGFLRMGDTIFTVYQLEGKIEVFRIKWGRETIRKNKIEIHEIVKKVITENFDKLTNNIRGKLTMSNLNLL